MTESEAARREEYRRRQTRHQERAAAAGRLEERISGARLSVVLSGLLIGWLALSGTRLSPWWLVAPAAAFAALLVVHESVRGRRRQAERRSAFYRRGLARLDGHWAGAGRTGARLADLHHPFADALDLFGEGSLYELLCEARTSVGENTLAAWLLAPADAASVRLRQAAVQALTPCLDLREDLAVLGDEVAATAGSDALASLATSATSAPGPRLRLGAVAVSVATLSAVAAWGVGWAPSILMLGALALQEAFSRLLRGRVRSAEAAITGHGPDLDLIAAVLERFEREPLESPLLARLRADLISDGRRPSQAVRRLRGWVNALDARRNQFIALFAWVIMLRVHSALAVEAWRARHGASVGTWLAAVGQLEALCSLAGYAWEHPDDVYPSVEEGETCFEAEGLGHPLIPEARCVRNDVALGGSARVLIVSGSNMSGKSTLLRAVGTNTTLALAGAPVRASRLRLSPLSLGATLLIRDSLQEGTSRFYAELVRLRDIVRIADGPVPLLFLLDEILHGTNSHDRRLGAAAVVRGLVQRGAVGLVTTHDLALSEMADDPDVHAVNVHFEDRLENGRMVFDYRMRPGVVRTSNALALMRTLGLWPDAPAT
jgi:hypothetical protein